MVQTPFGCVTMHIVQTPGVGFFLSDWVRPAIGIVEVPAICSQFLRIIAERIGCLGSGPTGVFPLRFSGQSIRFSRLGGEPSAVLHGRMVGDTNDRWPVPPQAKGFVGIRWRGTGDGVGGLLCGRLLG